MKSIDVSVIYRGSKNPKIVIELTQKAADQLTNGHENITNCVFDEIRKASVFIDEHQNKRWRE